MHLYPTNDDLDLTLGGGGGGKANAAAAVATPFTRSNIFQANIFLLGIWRYLWCLPWRLLELWFTILQCKRFPLPVLMGGFEVTQLPLP